MENKKIVYWLLVALILLGSAGVRFVGLTSLPPGIYPDEAMNTTDGLATAEKGGWEWFYENNQGREGLYINILGYLLHWFGPSIFVVRFLPALIGFLTLPAVFWLGLRLAGRIPAIYALALMGFSYWHLNFSRIGFRALLMVFLITWTFAFLIEGLSRLKEKKDKKFWSVTGSTWFFALAGLSLGLSLHTYIAVRIVPAILIVAWLAFILLFREKTKALLLKTVIFGFCALITAAPLLLDFYTFPEHFSGRTNNVSVFKSENMVLDLAKTTGLTLASFVAYGDQNWRHNYPYLPLVLPFWGILLLGGIFYGKIFFLKQAFKSLIKKEGVNSKLLWSAFGWIFLIAWWVFLLLPSILTVEGIPHALRSIGSIPATFLIIAIVIGLLYKKKSYQKVFLFLMAVTVLVNMGAYFFLWGRSPQTYGAFEYRLSGMGVFLRELASNDQTTNLYVVANNGSLRTSVNLPVAAEPIRFFTWGVRDQINFIRPEELDQLQIKTPAKVFLMEEDGGIESRIRNMAMNSVSKKVRIGSLPVKEDDVVNFNPKELEGFLNPSIPVYADFKMIELK